MKIFEMYENKEIRVNEVIADLVVILECPHTIKKDINDFLIDYLIETLLKVKKFKEA